MLGLLEDLLEAVGYLPDYFLAGLVDTVNVLFDGVGGVIEVAYALLPTMPPAGSVAPGSVLEYANEFYPFGAVAGSFAAILVLYVGWLLVRYVLQLVRAA